MVHSTGDPPLSRRWKPASASNSGRRAGFNKDRNTVATDLRELKADIYELGRTLDDSGSNGIAPLIDRRRRNVSAVDRRRKYTNTASSHSNNGDMDESNINEGRRTEAKRRYRTPLASDECNRDNCLNRPSSINADNNCGRADEDPRKTGTRERSSKPSHSLDGEHGEYSREERKRAETAGVPSDPRWSGPLPRPSMKNPLSLAWDTSSNGIAATGISVGTNVGLSSVSADYGGVSRVGELVERIEASARAVARDKKDTINALRLEEQGTERLRLALRQEEAIKHKWEALKEASRVLRQRLEATDKIRKRQKEYIGELQAVQADIDFAIATRGIQSHNVPHTLMPPRPPPPQLLPPSPPSTPLQRATPVPSPHSHPEDATWNSIGSKSSERDGAVAGGVLWQRRLPRVRRQGQHGFPAGRGVTKRSSVTRKDQGGGDEIRKTRSSGRWHGKSEDAASAGGIRAHARRKTETSAANDTPGDRCPTAPATAVAKDSFERARKGANRGGRERDRTINAHAARAMRRVRTDGEVVSVDDSQGEDSRNTGSGKQRSRSVTGRPARDTKRKGFSKRRAEVVRSKSGVGAEITVTGPPDRHTRKIAGASSSKAVSRAATTTIPFWRYSGHSKPPAPYGLRTKELCRGPAKKTTRAGQASQSSRKARPTLTAAAAAATSMTRDHRRFSPSAAPSFSSRSPRFLTPTTASSGKIKDAFSSIGGSGQQWQGKSRGT